MAMLLQKTSSFTHRAFKYKYLNHLFSSPGLGTKVNYSTAISAQSLLKSGLQSCTCSRKLLQTHTAGHKWQLRHFSKESLIIEQDGETLIRSPYKDIYIPPVSFAEYMFSRLDEYKNINCLVSLSFQNHFILFSKYIIVKMVSKLIGPTVMILSFRTDTPGQTVQTQIRLLLGAVWSGSTLFAIPSASFGCITLRKSLLVQLLG